MLNLDPNHSVLLGLRFTSFPRKKIKACGYHLVPMDGCIPEKQSTVQNHRFFWLIVSPYVLLISFYITISHKQSLQSPMFITNSAMFYSTCSHLKREKNAVTTKTPRFPIEKISCGAWWRLTTLAAPEWQLAAIGSTGLVEIDPWK